MSLRFASLVGARPGGVQDDLVSAWFQACFVSGLHRAFGGLVCTMADPWLIELSLQPFFETPAPLPGHLSLEPKMDELKVIELQPGVAQLYVPITFKISPAGQTAQPARFLMNQVLVKTGDGWKITSILSIPAPQP
ncbi:hypothetical protein HZZ13_24350 [Bradyrhizobium sp. CNPSo 4010]|uniref:DUF4440 domain-containing protein n=1 Tax=Bradyrhizobium agreste TaxID=2751811 RepID=A0ABS0PUV2_9BRAD|nr:hypothetical protein [Bradyrhizobium agreste]MBH5400885.1 hypothetical protein [Bradyrhizobium agreste]